MASSWASVATAPASVVTRATEAQVAACREEAAQAAARPEAVPLVETVPLAASAVDVALLVEARRYDSSQHR